MVQVSVDHSLIIQIANFLFLLWVLNQVLYKPIRKILLDRKTKVDGLQAGIENSISEAKAQDDAYNTGIRDARSRGMKEKEKFLEAAAGEERAIVDKINQKAQAELAAIKAKITDDAQGVKAALEKEIGSFADAIGEKILGRAL